MRGDIEYPHDCRHCGRECASRRSLGNHLAKSHDDHIREYVARWQFPDGPPKCLCGKCDRPVEWHTIRYHFNDYVTGHNPSKIGEYRAPPEVVSRRNDSIRRAYAEHGDEIKAKIAGSLIEAFTNPTVKQKLVDRNNRMWADPGKRAMLTASRQRVWDERGEELRKKIFTPEFGRKIARANMNRKPSFVSKAEKEFFGRLRENGLTVVEDVWVNSDRLGLTKCFDARIGAVHVEFDGTYHHARAVGSMNAWQIDNVAGDLEKELLCRELGIDLVRVWEGVDPSGVRTVDDLRAVGHPWPRKFRDDEIIISRDDLLQLRRDKGSQYLQDELLPALTRFLVAHVALHGWFYPSDPPEHLLEDVVALRQRRAPSSRDLMNARPGRQSLGSRFHSFWHADRGPAESFADDEMLRKVLAYRIGLGPSKDYTYELSDGTSVTGPECFDISLSMIRRGYVMRRGTVSWFAPSVAVDAMNLLDVVRGATIWDPSGGFGARMLAAFSRDPTCRYICNEPARLTSLDLMALAEELMGIDPRFRAEVIVAGSEAVGPDPGTCDLVLTSPPYFDKERYFDEPGQCWRDFPTAAAWESGYVAPTVRAAARALKPGGILVLNVDPERLPVFEEAAGSTDLIREPGSDMRLMLRRDHMNRAMDATDTRAEPIAVWRRPSS